MHLTDLAETATRHASTQSWLTIRLLADRERRSAAFRLYAYFRWIDDMLDEQIVDPCERLVFVERQRTVLRSAMDGDSGERVPVRNPEALVPQERMLIDLVQGVCGREKGLALSLENMYAVMEFDACRRGQVVDKASLDIYTRQLSIAVTEALHLCIGYDCFAPQDETRYAAVAGAHIAHMLRDHMEDMRVGYCNVPRETLEATPFDLEDVASANCRAWVRERVCQARHLFAVGREYLSHVESLRCRLAGHAYIARFVWVLDTIEQEQYLLRADYRDRKRLLAGMRIGAMALGSFLGGSSTHALAKPHVPKAGSVR